MSRAVMAPDRDDVAGEADVSGACCTIVVVLCSPTAPAPSRTPAVTPPPIMAAASGITNERAGIASRAWPIPVNAG